MQDFERLKTMLSNEKRTEVLWHERSLEDSSMNEIVSRINSRMAPIKTLNLLGNELSDDCVEELLKLEKGKIKNINLSNNNFTLAGAVRLLKSGLFEHIDFTRNNIKLTREVVDDFSEFCTNSGVSVLCIMGNRIVDNSDPDDLYNALHNSGLSNQR